MTRIALFSVLAACATTTPPRSKPAPPVTNTQPTTTYALPRMHIPGGEGRHSAWHSSSDVQGTLSVTGERATLWLHYVAERSPVLCNFGPNTHTLQACADPGSQPVRTEDELILVGTARWTGALHVDVAKGDDRVTLTCNEDGAALRCAITKSIRILSPLGGEGPSELVFQRSEARFARR